MRGVGGMPFISHPPTPRTGMGAVKAVRVARRVKVICRVFLANAVTRAHMACYDGGDIEGTALEMPFVLHLATGHPGLEGAMRPSSLLSLWLGIVFIGGAIPSAAAAPEKKEPVFEGKRLGD